MKQALSYKRVFFTLGLMVAATGSAWYFLSDNGPIYTYDEARDKHDIVTLFEADRHWLTDNPGTSIDFMLKYRASSTRLSAIGTMGIKVLREADGKFVGFVTYFMENKHVGRILFLAVHPDFRGKRYGEQLLKDAINELKKMGAQCITLTTRLENKRAQNLYNRAGFVEQDRDDTYVHFNYCG